MSNEQDRAGAADSPDAERESKRPRRSAEPDPATKTQDLTGAREEGFDPDTGQD